jgi:RNA polymerase sigma factor FliA
MADALDRKRLIEDHLSYVRALASQLRKEISSLVDPEDLVAYGSKGLVEAAERFDPTRGASFTTFAYYRIRGAMVDGLRLSGWLPRRSAARFAVAADEYLANLSERTPERVPAAAAVDPVADLGQTLDDVATIFIAALQGSEADEGIDAAQALEEQEQRRAVRRALTRLPDKERRMIELHYFEDQSLQDAGKALGLSKSWSSRLHARAVRLLSDELRHLER